jgi:hypothetical protein
VICCNAHEEDGYDDDCKACERAPTKHRVDEAAAVRTHAWLALANAVQAVRDGIVMPPGLIDRLERNYVDSLEAEAEAGWEYFEVVAKQRGAR